MFRNHLSKIYILVMALFLVSTTKGMSNNAGTWNKQLMYKTTANLTCEDNQFNPLTQQEAAFLWLLPSGKVIGATVLPQDDRYTLVNNGSSLLITDIDKVDFGVYFCLVRNNSQSSTMRAIKFGINVDGPYFGDMWEKYQSNLKNGLLASAVTFVIMSMFCYNHSQFQNRFDQPSTDRSSNNIYEGQNMAHLNSAFAHELQEKQEDYTDQENSTDAATEPETKL